jgi:hypothetical protein
MLTFPFFLDSRLIDGGKVVSPTRQPPFTPKNILRIFLVLISVKDRVDTRAHSAAGRIRSVGQNPITTSGLEPATFRLVA